MSDPVVYILFYSPEYDSTDIICGVFTTREKAEAYKVKLSEDEEFAYIIEYLEIREYGVDGEWM